MNDAERAARIAEIQAARAARGMADPLNRLIAHNERLIAAGQESITEIPAGAPVNDGSDGPHCPWSDGCSCSDCGREAAETELAGIRQAMRLAAEENRQAGYADLKARAKAIESQLYDASGNVPSDQCEIPASDYWQAEAE